MRIKSGVWYWLAVASGAVGLLYGMGLEGSFQTGGTVSDGAFITAMVLILLAVFILRKVWKKRPKKEKLPPMTGRNRSAAGCTGSPATP